MCVASGKRYNGPHLLDRKETGMTNTRALTLIFFVLAGLALGIMFPGESSAVFTSYDVNTTADDPGITMTACTAVDPPGPCSLRGAIKGANNHSGADGVTFHIGIGVQTISLASPLEPISDAVTIDGTTQGFHGQPCISVMGKPCIVINGSSAGAGANGLDLATQGITVKGLAIVGFLLTGIRSENQSGNITIVQNFIGTADGATASPNGTGIFAAADNPNYVIERNVISGNTGAGIVAGSGTPINHVIRGNFIGVTASGSGDLGNGGDGVEAIGPHTIGGTVVGAGNVISGNGGIGLRLSSGEQ
jgi:CSLREA domain-containing protein